MNSYIDFCPPTMTLAVGLKPWVVLQPLVAKADTAIATVILIVSTVLEKLAGIKVFLFSLEVERLDDIMVPNNKCLISKGNK